MRDRLRRKGFAPEITEMCVDQLCDLAYLDDESFCRDYVDYARERKPMGRIRLKQELRKRGVDGGLIERALVDMTEEEEKVMAQRALQRRGGVPDEDLSFEERQRHMRRLFAYLARRGFSQSLIRRLLDPYALGS